MILDEIREKLQDIARGARLQGTSDRCSTIRNILVESFGTGPTVKSEFESRAILKEKQASFLKSHSKELNIWLDSLPEGSEYLTRAGSRRFYRYGVLCDGEVETWVSWAAYISHFR